MGKKYSSFFFPYMAYSGCPCIEEQNISLLCMFRCHRSYFLNAVFFTNYTHQPFSGRINFNRNTYSKWKLNGKMENPSLIIQKYSLHKPAKLTRCGECLRSYSFWGIIPPSPGAVEKAIYQGKNIIKK